ncbi:MAG: DedA family protein [Alphaproteobacteria bacterium]|nr:DedA family protein [Alphaproteobacteria bacterium]
MVRAAYDWTMRLGSRPRAVWPLALVSFSESSFFPIPPDVLLIPMVLAARERAWFLAAVCSVSSVVGGLFGYAIGYFLYATFGRWLIAAYGLEEAFVRFQADFAEWGLWVILIKGLTPIPFKIVTIASGAAHFDLTVFILALIVTRAGRFFLVSALLWRFGVPIRSFIEGNLTWLLLLVAALVVGGFLLVRYVV